MDGLKIRLIKRKYELEAVFKIRKEVFVKGQHVPESMDLDGLDNNSKQVIVLYQNKPIGCARIRFLDGKAKLERIAILSEYQGKGIGMELMNYLVKYCRRNRVNRVVMHSQYHATGFYEKCGFKTKGEKFMDAGIEHIEMELPV
jgi:predicted GNAT family N-acyltransferase